MTMISYTHKPHLLPVIRFLIKSLILTSAGCAHRAEPVPVTTTGVQEPVKTPTKHEETGEIVRSVEELKIALTIDPDNKTTREELNRLVVKHETEAEAHFRAGTALSESNPQMARKEFLEAIRLRSNYPEALNALRDLHLASVKSVLQARLKKEAAIAAARSKGKHASGDDDTYPEDYSLETAVSAFEAGKYVTAIKEFEKMNAEYPNDPDIQAYLERSWYNSGVGHFNKKDYRKALAAFSKVRKGFERVEEYSLTCRQNLKGMIHDYFAAGVKSYNENKFQEAVNKMKIVLEIDPDHKQAKEYMENARKQLKTRKKQK
jgi:tetratricopeptide (TPR) repeat protein